MSAVAVLLRQRIRRDRWIVPIWIVSTGALALFSAAAIVKTYGDEAARMAVLTIAVTEGRPILLLRGLPNGADVGSFTFFQIFTYLALMAGFMSTFLAVRHSRAEEDSGRAELIGSTTASRTAPTIATIVHGVLANLVLGAAVALGFLGGKLDPVGSLVTGLATSAVGIAFLAVGLVAAQLMSTSRGANGLSVSVLGAAFMLRGIGDALGTASEDNLHVTSSWISWISPIGWAQHVAAFDTNNLTPLLLNLVLAVVLLTAVFVLQHRRDSGASLIAARPGRLDASPALSSSFALALRLQRSTIIGWAIGGAASGLLAGGLSGLLQTVTAANGQVSDTLTHMVGGGGSLAQTLIAVMFTIVATLAAGCAVQAIVRMRQEEASGTAELLLATPTSRVRWFADYLLVGAIAIVAVLASAALVASIAVLATTGDAERVSDSWLSAAAQLPASFVFLALIALVFTVAPGATAGVGWALYGALTFVGVFGGLIDAPEWLRNLSPFTHTPVPFGSDVDWSGGVWMLLVSALAVAAAATLMRRRELRT
jgi:ABC-2 type transport system permease protein